MFEQCTKELKRVRHSRRLLSRLENVEKCACGRTTQLGTNSCRKFSSTFFIF